MTTQVILTLNSPIGGNVGPSLTLTADVGIVVPNTATVAQLLAGFIVTIDTLATIISATSSGDCDVTIPLNVPTPCLCYTVSADNRDDRDFASVQYKNCDTLQIAYYDIPADDIPRPLCSAMTPIPVDDGITILGPNGPCSDDETCDSISIPCNCYTVTINEDPAYIKYVDCNGNTVQTSVYPGESVVKLCAIGILPRGGQYNWLPSTEACPDRISCLTTTTTTTLCPCNDYLFVGGKPITSFTFRECGASIDTIIGVTDVQSFIYCVDNGYPISQIGGGSYGINGDPALCCTPTTSTTTTSTTSTTSTTTTTTAAYCGECYSLYVTKYSEGNAEFKYTDCDDKDVTVTVSGVSAPVQVCSKTIPVITDDGNLGAGVYSSGVPCNNDCSPVDKACLCYTAVNYLGVSNTLYYRPCGTTTGAYATHTIAPGGSWTVCASGPVFFSITSGASTPIYFGGICDLNDTSCDPVIPTTTTTSTTADPYNIKVYNYTNTGSITSVSGTTAFYTIGEGFFPVPANSHVFGIHGSYTGTIKVKIVDTVPGHVTLYKNFVQVGCINTTGSGEYTFLSQVFSPSDIITVTYSIGSC